MTLEKQKPIVYESLNSEKEKTTNETTVVKKQANLLSGFAYSFTKIC